MTDARSENPELQDGWISTAHIAAAERNWLTAFLADKPWYEFYFRSAMSALAAGQDNRFHRFGGARSGLIMGISFDQLDVCTFVGVSTRIGWWLRPACWRSSQSSVCHIGNF